MLAQSYLTHILRLMLGHQLPELKLLLPIRVGLFRPDRCSSAHAGHVLSRAHGASLLKALVDLALTESCLESLSDVSEVFLGARVGQFDESFGGGVFD